MKLCSKCKNREVPKGFPGDLCVECSLDQPDEANPYYQAKDLAQLLQISEEQVRRKAREGKIPRGVPGIRRRLWLKSVIKEWIGEGQPVPRIPTSPLQEEARALCKKKDHSWLHDDKYDGIAYAKKDETRMGEHTVKIGWRHTCYFCGFSQYIQFG